jgi:DNA-binding NarL/FixJ family response regulator
MARIFLLLNDPLVAARMRTTLDAVPGMQVVGWVNTLTQSLAQIPQVKPELVIADLQFVDGAVATVLRELSDDPRHGRPKVLVGAMTLGDPMLFEALSRGADGYFLQGRSSEGPVEAVRQALAGEAAMAPEIARQVKAHFDALAWDPTDFVGESLNPLHPDATERLLLQWIADGYLVHEIARQFRLTPAEVGRRIRTLYRKLQYDLRAATLTLAA